MTLVLCLKGDGCVVFAADSLTTRGEAVLNTATRKVHKTSDRSLAAACGAARVNGQYWSQILPRFTATGSHPTATELRPFLDTEIAKIDRSNIGARGGGNTFIVADLAPAATQPEIWRIVRSGDDSTFKQENLSVPAAEQRYIEWFGDTAQLRSGLDDLVKAYRPGMPEQDAIEFAVDILGKAIEMARDAAITTIGGDFISVASLSPDGVREASHPF